MVIKWALLSLEIDMACGIYIIENIVTDKKYVGSTNDFDRRWLGHQKDLLAAKHCNERMTADFRVYGLQSFRLRIHKLLPINMPLDEVYAHETACMKELIDQSVTLYNAKWAGDGWSYIDPTDKLKTTEKAIASRAATYAALTPEEHSVRWKQQGHDMNTFARLSPEALEVAKQKISSSMKGKKRGPMSDEHKAKIAAARRKV